MIEDSAFEKTKVYLNDLSNEMVILSYIGFAKKYHSLSKQTCAFLKYHFKGADALVGREDKRYSIPMGFIQENDFLYKIENLPSSLTHLTQVNDRLKRSLRSHGMLRFEVMRPVTLTLDNHRDLIYLINLVKTRPSTQI